MPDCMPAASRRITRQLIGAAAMILLPGAWLAYGQSADTGRVFTPCLQTAQILKLAGDLASTDGPPDSYASVVKAAFHTQQGGAVHVTAFEENKSFVYAVARMLSHESKTPGGRPAETISPWIRRLIILNASIFVVDDQVLSPIPPEMHVGCLSSATVPQVSGRKARIVEASGEISSEMLFPDNLAYQVKPTGRGQEPGDYVLETTQRQSPPTGRFLQVLHVGKSVQAGGALQHELIPTTGKWKLTVTVGDRVFRLTLPPPTEGAGEITIASLEGKNLVGSRPLPSGVLPHGPKGNRLLEYWDSAYRGRLPAPWDIGRPADELQSVVEGGKVKRCRVVDLCCGTGSDAIYLARQGFDVTGIDVSPTALSQAQQKAQDANVSVQWVLADILAPPDLKPFDFLYDRACYHVVRDQNLKAYLETVRRFSHPGSDFLLLSARHEKVPAGASWGVTEDELRSDFLTLFDVEWLREIRLEISRPELGPPAWSAFLKRRAAP